MGWSILNTAGSVASIVAACASLYGVWAVRSLTVRFRHRQGLDRWTRDLDEALSVLETYPNGRGQPAYLIDAVERVFWVARQVRPGADKEVVTVVDALTAMKDPFSRAVTDIRQKDRMTDLTWDILRRGRMLYLHLAEARERRWAGED